MHHQIKCGAIEEGSSFVTDQPVPSSCLLYFIGLASLEINAESLYIIVY